MEQMTELFETMMTLTRSSILNVDPDILSDLSIDWDRLMDISREHGLIAWVNDGITKLPREVKPTRSELISWGLSSEEIISTYKKQYSVLCKMIEVCEKNSIRLLLLKGVGLANLYPRPELRSCGDIDIYLFNHYKEGNTLFGVDSLSETGLHSSFDFDGVNVENHQLLIYPNTKIKKAVGEYLLQVCDSAIATETGYYVLPPIPNLVYLLMHTLNHFDYTANTNVIAIRNLLDISMFLLKHQPSLPPSELYSILQRLHLDLSFEMIVYIAEWLLKIDLADYHRGAISVNDVEAILDFFEKYNYSLLYHEEWSLLKKSVYIRNRYYKIKPIAKYVPKKPKNGLLYLTMHQQCSLLLRNRL